MEYNLISERNKNVTEVEQVLMNRGIPLAEISHYLNTNENDIEDPLLLKNLKEGAQLLISHIKRGNKIYLQIDNDADGFTSFAVFMNYFHNLFPSFVQNNIAYKPHNGKGHGIVIEQIPEDTSLVIALDASSNEYEIHKTLSEREIDVLILDHHIATHESSYACVINNQLCDYPTKSLSGVGIVYKFCSYIDSLLGVEYADKYLDLVSLGMIADMEDLRDFETKHLIHSGFNNVQSPFITTMMTQQSYSMKGVLTPMTVAFYIAPYVNAVTRVGTLDEALLLAESMLEYKAYEKIPSTKRGCSGQMETRVEQACRTASNVRARQNRARDNSLEFVENLIEENDLLKNKILIIQVPRANGLDTNITGLIGNQASARYQRPVLILNEREHDGEIWWEGSARGLENSKLSDFRGFLLNNNLVEYAEGHSNAFGVGIKDKNISDFIQRTEELLKDIEFSPAYKVDFIWNADTVNPASILSLADYNHLWGQNLSRPKVVIENIPITNNYFIMKGPSIKFTHQGIEIIKFKATEEEIKIFEDNAINYITILGECEINNWGGNMRPQILITDYEIRESLKYYF